MPHTGLSPKGEQCCAASRTRSRRCVVLATVNQELQRGPVRPPRPGQMLLQKALLRGEELSGVQLHHHSAVDAERTETPRSMGRPSFRFRGEGGSIEPSGRTPPPAKKAQLTGTPKSYRV